MSKFKNWLILQGYSKGTINTYISLTRQILNKTKDITKQNINSFFLELNCPIETYNSYIKALRAYLKYIKLDLPTPKLKKTPFKIPESITLKYFEDVIISIIDLIFLDPLKIKTILYFMFFTALRKSEIYTLKRKNFNFTNNTVKIYEQKTQKERISIYPNKVKKLIKLYFSLIPEENNAFNIGKGGIEYYFREINKHVNINFHPHLLRHSGLTHLANQGMRLKHLQKFAGHQNIQTTERYINISDEDVKNAYDEAIKKKNKNKKNNK